MAIYLARIARILTEYIRFLETTQNFEGKSFYFCGIYIAQTLNENVVLI